LAAITMFLEEFDAIFQEDGGPVLKMINFASHQNDNF
jgi:hypothetical protein